MATRSTFTKPPHISDRAWALAGEMTLRQLAGQLTSIDPGRYQQLAGEDIALAVARGEIGGTGLVGDRLRELQEIAVANGHPPLMVKDDGRRGFYLVAPFPALLLRHGDWCGGRTSRRRSTPAHAGVTLIRLTCDYAFAQNQGRTQEGGLISCPRFMSDVTRASTEGLTASGRIAVILKHMGPYQYTAGPDYTALPIERTEFLETVLPRYAGGFEAGAHGVMMSFVALNGVPAHADPFLRDLVKAKAGPGAIIESDYDGIYELYGGFGYASSPKEAALRAFREGGVHIDLCSLLYLRYLPELVEEGRIGEEELLVRAAEMLHLQGARRRARRPATSAPPPTASRSCSPAPRPPTAIWRRPRWSCCGRPGRTRPCCRSRPRPARCASACSGRSRTRTPRTGSAPTRATPTTISSGSRRRSPGSAGTGRTRPTRAAATTTSTGGDRRAMREQLREAAAAAALARDATHVVLFLGEPHKWSGESATLAEPRLPYHPAPARASWCAGPTPARSSSSSSPPAGRCTSRRRSRRTPTPSSGRRTSAASPATPSPTSSPASAARPRGSRTGCRSPTGSPPASTRGRRGSTGRPCRWCRARPRGGSATTGAPTTSASAPAGRRPTTSAKATPTPPSSSPTGRSTPARSRSRPARALTASVRVTNTGSRAGTETVHLYYQDMVCEERVPRLLERLGHRQVTLDPGESATLTFTVTPAMLAKYGRDPEAGPRVWPDREPGGEPRPAVPRPARRTGARRHRTLRRRALRAPLHRASHRRWRRPGCSRSPARATWSAATTPTAPAPGRTRCAS